jgi:hypothetical protein
MYGNQGALTRLNLAKGTTAASERNCEFCAAAGAVNLTPAAPRQTSKDAANFAGLSDDKPSSGNYTEQAARIARFVTAKTGLRWGSSGGSKFLEKPFADAEKFMLAMRDRTVFVIYVSGPTVLDVVTKPVYGNRSHWLNAIKAGDSIRYFDFQTNREYTGGGLAGKSQAELQPVGGKNPSSSTLPFVGIETQSVGSLTPEEKSETQTALHSSDYRLQKGIIDTAKAKMLAIAFFPGPK